MQLDNSDNPIFSIIVPMYNVDKYIEKCLLSISNQTLKDIEVIMVDDGSTDLTLDICTRISTEHKNFRIYSKNNEGQGIARNYGIERANGNYICFVDSDDWIEPEVLEEMRQVMDSSDADFANFGIDFVSPSGGKLKSFGHFTVSELNGEEILYRALLEDQILSSPCNKVYRRNFLNDHSIRFPPLRSNEDLYFSRAISLYACKTVFVSKVYYHALVRPDSTSRRMTISIFTDTERLIDFEKCMFVCDDRHLKFTYAFHAHIVKVFSYLLIQAAFRIKNYNEYIACFTIANRCGFHEHLHNSNTMFALKIKNRLMAKLCLYPRLLKIVAILLKFIGIRPY